jgi:hypothetical protein
MRSCAWVCGSLLSVLVLLTGCTRNAAYHLHDSAPAPNLIEFSSANDHTGTPLTTKPLTAAPVITVEFDEQGKLFACKDDAECQVTRATTFIHDARRLTGTKHLIVLTFVHGWHHNASDRDGNLQNFRSIVSCLNLGSAAQPENRRGNQPVICQGLQSDPANSYIGVYIAWRGESVEPWLTEAATSLSLASRHAAAVRMASNDGPDGIAHLILTLSSAAKSGNNPARFLLIGHSFGGLIVGRVTEELFFRRLFLDEAHKVPPAPSRCIGQFADLVVLLNPADSSIRLANLVAEWKKVKPCSGSNLNSDLSRPLLISIHTSSDGATDALGTWLLSHTRYDADYAASNAAHWAARGDSENSVDTKWQDGSIHTVSIEDLRGNTVNYSPYLRNLCYLDQANRQDPICLGLNDSIHHLKEDSWTSTIGRTPPSRLNTNYSLDPYYHGAYELLTAVCFEPWEGRGKAKNMKHEFAPDFISQPCNSETRLKRDKLRVDLEKRLGPYLAFPEPRGAFGDVLLDVYARMYSGCYRAIDINDADGEKPPDDCATTSTWTNRNLKVGDRPWNDTPVWQLNTSYEIIQAHSGFWNADAASLLIALASQFQTVPYDSKYETLPQLAADLQPSGNQYAQKHRMKQPKSSQQQQQQRR